MNIDMNSTVEGIRLIEIRNAIRATVCPYIGYIIPKENLRYRLDLSVNKFRKIVSWLIKNDICVNVKKRDRFYEDEECIRLSNENGFRFMTSKAKRFYRDKAQQKLQEFIDRAKQINNDDSYIYKVKKIDAFGSILDDSKNTIGDIDLVVILGLKREPTDEERRFDYLSNQYSTIVKFLKNHSPIFHLQFEEIPFIKHKKELLVA